MIIAVTLGAAGCDDGRLGDACDTASDCASGYKCVRCSIQNACYFDDINASDAYVCKEYGVGSAKSGGSSSGSSSSTGACAYYKSDVNRVVCSAPTSSSKCSGKFFPGATSCKGLSCTSATRPSSCTLPGSSTGGSSGGSSCDASTVWKCENDPQVVTMCQAACVYTGSERSQTCQVLAQMMSKSAGSCCTVCK